MQSTNHILLVRPANFGFNVETSASNAFQNKAEIDSTLIQKKALIEFDMFTEKIREKGILVTIVNDSIAPVKPDAIFPNNWISFHTNGTVVLYPMFAKNRRLEKRQAIIDQIAREFEIKKIIDFSVNEKEKRFLEGTGSIIFDHKNKIAYACLSARTDKQLFIECGEMLGFKTIYFKALDNQGQAIYHTNVMMNIGNGYVVICLESITDENEKQHVVDYLTNSSLEIIEISIEQTFDFCGNMLELEIVNGKNILAMSQSAFDRLSAHQKVRLENYCELFPLSIPTIENIGGGSVRCMIAEIFLPKKNLI